MSRIHRLRPQEPIVFGRAHDAVVLIAQSVDLLIEGAALYVRVAAVRGLCTQPGNPVHEGRELLQPAFCYIEKRDSII